MTENNHEASENSNNGNNTQERSESADNHTAGRPDFNYADPNVSLDDIGLGLFNNIPNPGGGRGFEFFDAAKVGINKAFTIKGRACRSEFWYFYLASTVIHFLALMVPVLGWAVSLFFTIACFTATVRRLHDRGVSGLLMVPVLLSIALFVIGFTVVMIHLIVNGVNGNSISPGCFIVLILLGGLTFVMHLIVFIICVLPADSDTNKYGTNPLL